MSWRKAWQAWDHFWFAPVPLINLALFRIGIGLTLFLMYLDRQKDVGLFFTDQGVLPKALAFQVLPEIYRPIVNLSFWSDDWVSGLHVLFLGCLLLFTLGVGGRLVALVCVYFNLAFLQRNHGIVFGADQIGAIFLLYLSLTNCCSRFSILNWKRKRPVLDYSQDLWTPLFYRMSQVQLCVIYFYSGVQKLKGASWWDGTALWNVFVNPQIVLFDLSWTKNFPLAIVFVTFFTLVYETYFPVLILFSRVRNWFLGIGFLFHGGIALLMALYAFVGVMTAPYFLFLDVEFIKKVFRRLRIPVY